MQKARRELQRGFSTLMIIIGVLIGSMLTAFTVTVLVPQVASVEADGVFQEINAISKSVRMVREYGGDYANLTSFSVLIDRGYIADSHYTDGVNENRYGLTITVAPSNSNTDATVTYGMSDAATCLNMVDRSGKVASVKSASCGGDDNTTLTFVVE